MEINLSKGIQLPTLPGAKGLNFAVKKLPQETITPSGPVAPDGTDPVVAVDQKRYEQVARAAKAYFKDVYAVSDTRFTIYKDTSGQYITRYTSLRDGKVTYIPEPSLLQYLERSRASRESLVELSV
jgi:hypothetical protein